MEQTPRTNGTAFTAGYDSGWDGAPRADNPNKADSAEAEQWLEGWDEGLAKRNAVTPSRMQAMSGTTETEPTEPGEKGELAAIQGEPPTANPYAADSVEAEEWLDGHDYATATEAEEALPHPARPSLGPDQPVDELEEPPQGVTVPAAGEA